MPEARHVVMITGASRGLGRALALAFAEGGFDLVLCARGEEGLESVAGEVEARGAGAAWAAGSVTDADAIDRLVRAAESRFGRIDALVNNASILGGRGPLREQPLEEWRKVMDVNVTGVLVPTLAVLPGMRDRGAGSIINVSSGVGDRPRENWGAYGVSKRAVEALTWNLALEESGAGIRANVVDPGAMRTAMRRSAYPDEDPETLPDPAASTPVFLWLASPASADITGQRFRAQEWGQGRV